jgi:hypothetical protein
MSRWQTSKTGLRGGIVVIGSLIITKDHSLQEGDDVHVRMKGSCNAIIK